MSPSAGQHTGRHHTQELTAQEQQERQLVLRACTALSSRRMAAGDRLNGQRGEGIVSVAIAVLIMAALGVVAYGAFDALFTNTTDAAETQIGSIGGG